MHIEGFEGEVQSINKKCEIIKKYFSRKISPCALDDVFPTSSFFKKVYYNNNNSVRVRRREEETRGDDDGGRGGGDARQRRPVARTPTPRGGV